MIYDYFRFTGTGESILDFFDFMGIFSDGEDVLWQLVGSILSEWDGLDNEGHMARSEIGYIRLLFGVNPGLWLLR